MMMQQRALLTQEEITRQRVEVLGRVYQTADRVLTGDRIDVVVVTDYGNPAPAWTDGTRITLNLAHIDSATSVEDLIRLTGLNFHELGHAMFTPRKATRLVRSVISNGWFSAFNILEDQRLETFLTVMYPSTVPYFTATIMKYCAQNQSAWEGNFLLTYGRKYLPKKVRDEFRLRFKKPELIPEAVDIIDAYRQCVFPRDDAEGLALIGRFNTVLRTFGDVPDDPNGHSGNGRPPIDNGGAASQAEQEEAVDNIADWDDYYDDDDADDDNDVPDDNDGNGGSADGDDEDESGNGKSGKKGDEEGDDSDADDSGTGSTDDGEDGEDGNGDAGSEAAPPTTYDDEGEGDDADSSTGNGAGNEGGTPQPMSDQDLEDLLNAKADEAATLPEVLDDAKRKQDTIVNGDGKVDSHFPDASTTTAHPDATHLSTVRRLVKEFHQLEADSDPGYRQYRSSGRINIQRVITEGVDFDSMFDEWDEGQQNATDIEAVVLVDISTSMRGKAAETSMALWTIKRALDEVEASTTVYAFSAHGMTEPATYLLYGRDKHVAKDTAKVFSVVGGTQPSEAIREAMRVFYTSRRTHKVFIVITDGAWFYGEPLNGISNDDAILRMNDNGITTALAYIGDLSENAIRETGYDHNCQIIRGIERPEHLVGWAREIVTTVAKNLRRTR